MARPDENDDEFDIDIDEGGEEFEIDVIDDTPEADRGREPLPKDLLEELEADELGQYDEKVKQRLKQMKKAWHDERRAKETAVREQNEAISVAQKLFEDNKALRGHAAKGESALVGSYKETVELELDVARKEYKEAYEAGDTEKLLEAQEKLNDATYRLNSLKSYRPALQEPEAEVAVVNTPAAPPKPDQRTLAWQERNSAWWGVDPEMTATALGVHQKLEQQHGAGYVGSDDYWRDVDGTMRKRYPDFFGKAANRGQPAARRATVVAPATRSSAPRRSVTLTKSQVALTKRLGITPEQYAKEFIKTEQ